MVKPSKQRNVIAVDLDGVLCEEGYWENYAKAFGIAENIEKINKLYDKGYVILIHTSRLEKDRAITTYWLKDHKVKYTALVMEKLRADYYIDDKNLSIDELK